MSKENYVVEETAILALDKVLVKSPEIPVAISLQEGEDLAVWVVPDKKRLKHRGLDMSLLESINLRIGALRYQQGLWQADTDSRKRALEDWKVQNPIGYNLRAILFHFMRFAFQDDPDLLRRLDEIAKNSGHADMVQDLMSLSLLGSKNTGLLKKINFDLTQLDTAATLSGTLADLLALNNGDKKKANAVKDLRDRAYTHLKIAVDKIRSYGKLEFWRDPDRLEGYASQHRRD
jgi:hypothetical protein